MAGIGRREPREMNKSPRNQPIDRRGLGNRVQESVERLRLPGDPLIELGFTLARVGDGWKVDRQTSAIFGTPALGMALPTTIEEFEEA